MAGEEILLPFSVNDFFLSPEGRYAAILGLDHVRYLYDFKTCG